jgi:hypothetical protein
MADRWPSQNTLTKAQVLEALALVRAGASQKAVAEQLGVSATYLGLIVRGLRQQGVSHGTS